jgi:aspartyl-tRNA(Asn)/glutamyl-tRNA(Gln) amidotransferase subunit B
MTPAEYEWQCELAETEIKGLMRENPDKVAQARERPQLIGWFVGQAAKNLGGCDDHALLSRLASELIMSRDRV